MYKNPFAPKGTVKELDLSIILPFSTNMGYLLLPCSSSGKSHETEMYKLLHTKWVKIAEQYRSFWANKFVHKPGAIQVTQIQSDLASAQCLFLNDDGEVDAAAMKQCMVALAKTVKDNKGSLHVALSVASIPGMKEILVSEFLENGLSIYVYKKD